MLKKERELALAQEVSSRLTNRQRIGAGDDGERELLDAVGGAASDTADHLGDSSALASVFLKANKLWEESTQHGFKVIAAARDTSNTGMEL